MSGKRQDFRRAIEALAAHETQSGGIGKSLIDDVVFVSGVSGGSVPAVYFALHGAKTIPAFRDNFLYKDPQSSFNTSVYASGNRSPARRLVSLSTTSRSAATARFRRFHSGLVPTDHRTCCKFR
jgi:hypothetical protein